MSDWVSAVGFVQFDPGFREVNSRKVIDLVIKTPGTDGVRINVTVWPEQQTPEVLEIKRGDFLAVEGRLSVREYTDRDGVNRTYINISANKIAAARDLGSSRE